MSEIIFKNGSTIKTSGSCDSIRGQRAAIDPFYYEPYPIFNKEEFDKVISEFLNKERMNKSNEVDSDIYLSSRKEDTGMILHLSKRELKQGLMGYFAVNEDIGDVHMVETTMDISEIDKGDLEKVDEKTIDNMIEYIFTYHVRRD